MANKARKPPMLADKAAHNAAAHKVQAIRAQIVRLAATERLSPALLLKANRRLKAATLIEPEIADVNDGEAIKHALRGLARLNPNLFRKARIKKTLPKQAKTHKQYGFAYAHSRKRLSSF